MLFFTLLIFFLLFIVTKSLLLIFYLCIRILNRNFNKKQHLIMLSYQMLFSYKLNKPYMNIKFIFKLSEFISKSSFSMNIFFVSVFDFTPKPTNGNCNCVIIETVFIIPNFFVKLLFRKHFIRIL